MTEASFGKMPTTRHRRFSSLFNRSINRVGRPDLSSVLGGEGSEGEDFRLGPLEAAPDGRHSGGDDHRLGGDLVVLADVEVGGVQVHVGEGAPLLELGDGQLLVTGLGREHPGDGARCAR